MTTTELFKNVKINKFHIQTRLDVLRSGVDMALQNPNNSSELVAKLTEIKAGVARNAKKLKALCDFVNAVRKLDDNQIGQQQAVNFATNIFDEINQSSAVLEINFVELGIKAQEEKVS